MRILVAWNFSRYPRNPGFCETGIAYVLGLRALGHDVVVVEEADPNRLFDESWQPVAFEDWPGRRGFEAVLGSYGVWPRACLLHEHGAATHGMPFAELAAFADGADLLLDVGSRIRTPEVFEAVRSRAYVDQAPVKTQVNAAEYGLDYYGLDRYEHVATIGLNIGRPGNPIPTCGLDWKLSVQPVSLPMWPVADGPGERYTTLSNWAGRHTFHTGGEYTGEKADAWLRLLGLPGRTEQPLEVTLSVRPGYEQDLDLFRSNGWRLGDPEAVATYDDYREYIASSRGELSPAHERYVKFQSGWFSDRSARYLASGRPVVVESTGIEDHLATGEGVLTFSTADEALAGIEAIESDYERHRRAARALAEEWFDAERVLARLLEDLGLEARAEAIAAERAR